MPHSARTASISLAFSEAWVWIWRSCFFASFTTCTIKDSVQHSTNRGANAYRSRPFAAPCHFAARRRLSSIEASVVSCRLSGRPPGSSIIALPTVARMPMRSHAANTASVWCTVPMSKIAVVPVRSSSAAPTIVEV